MRVLEPGRSLAARHYRVCHSAEAAAKETNKPAGSPPPCQPVTPASQSPIPCTHSRRCSHDPGRKQEEEPQTSVSNSTGKELQPGRHWQKTSQQRKTKTHKHRTQSTSSQLLHPTATAGSIAKEKTPRTAEPSHQTGTLGMTATDQQHQQQHVIVPVDTKEITCPRRCHTKTYSLQKFDPGAFILSCLFNKVVEWSIIPASWKVSKTIFIHKAGSTDEAGNWHPISLLNITYKLFCACTARHLLAWCKSSDVLAPQQKGFMSTEGCLENNFTLKTLIRDSKKDQLLPGLI